MSVDICEQKLEQVSTLFLSALFAKVSIYSTLIIFEIKNGGKNKEK